MTSTQLLVLMLTQVSPQVFDNPAAWNDEKARDGIALQSRPIADSSVYEYKASVDVDLPVSALCDQVFAWGSGDKDIDARSRKVLRDGKDERVVYDQIEAPMVNNRDYAMTIHRYADLEGGVCRIRFWASNELAPARQDGWVRMDKVWGSWTFTPQSNGKTRLVYTLFADPGGSVPAVFIHGAHKDSVFASVKKALAKTKAGMQSAR